MNLPGFQDTLLFDEECECLNSKILLSIFESKGIRRSYVTGNYIGIILIFGGEAIKVFDLIGDVIGILF